jgi:hypothetical protein
MEQPELLAADIRKFVSVLQNQPQPKGFLEEIFA